MNLIYVYECPNCKDLVKFGIRLPDHLAFCTKFGILKDECKSYKIKLKHVHLPVIEPKFVFSGHFKYGGWTK